VVFWNYWGASSIGVDAVIVPSEALVTTKNKDEFEMDVTVREGTKVYRGKESGRRVADCPSAKTGGGS
jgi:hypothetical protein